MTGGGQVDPYGELDVSRDASSEEIRRAYRQVARRHHPDVSQDPGGPVPIRRSSRPRPAVGLRAVLELTDREAAHLARFPLTLTDAHGGRIVIPAGTGDGDQLMLRDRGELIVLRVRVHERLDSP
jgi:hypothetical protein